MIPIFIICTTVCEMHKRHAFVISQTIFVAEVPDILLTSI